MYTAAKQLNLTDVCDMVLDHIQAGFQVAKDDSADDLAKEPIVGWFEILEVLRKPELSLKFPTVTDLATDRELLSWFWSITTVETLLRNLAIDILVVTQQSAHVLSDQPIQRLPDGLADALRARMVLRPPPSMRTTTFPSERCNNYHLHGPGKTCFIMRVQYPSIDNKFFDAAMHCLKYKARKERGLASRLERDSFEEDSDDEPSSFEEFLQREKESRPELKVERDTAHMPGPQNEVGSTTDRNTGGIKMEED
jgi:hypothetical protein